MAVVHPYAVTVVTSPAFHNVVGVIRLGHLVVGINYDLLK